MLQAMLADVLAACGEHKDATIDAAELAARFKLTDEELEDHLQLLNLVNFGGGCYAVYAERVDEGRSIHVEKELYGDEFRRPARLSPLEAKALLLALDLVGPLVAADAGTTLDDVRAKLEAAFGRYDMRSAPRRSRRRSTKTCSRCCRPRSATARSSRSSISAARPRRSSRARSSRTTCAACAATGTATPGIARRDGERTFRVDRIREARALDETFERRESLTARVDGALGDQAGTASFWFSAEVARWELDRRPDTNRLADGAALASVPYGNERWLYAEVCRYLGDAVLLEPEALRAKVAARARELAALVRSHATASTS